MNDNDLRTIAELERRIHLSDPEFAARMAAGAPAEVRFPAVAALCAVLFILVPPVMLLFGWLGLIVTLDLFLAAIAVVLIRRRLHA
jgi:hypothetical protein